MRTRFDVYQDIAGGYRWRLFAANNEIVAVSESYTSRYGALNSARKVAAWASSATIPLL